MAGASRLGACRIRAPARTDGNGSAGTNGDRLASRPRIADERRLALANAIEDGQHRATNASGEQPWS
jgi:hypothetical protein